MSEALLNHIQCYNNCLKSMNWTPPFFLKQLSTLAYIYIYLRVFSVLFSRLFKGPCPLTVCSMSPIQDGIFSSRKFVSSRILGGQGGEEKKVR